MNQRDATKEVAVALWSAGVFTEIFDYHLSVSVEILASP